MGAPSFKDLVASDISNVFLNVEEFAEPMHVVYDGKDFGNIPVILDQTEQKSRQQEASDHGMGVYAVDAVFFANFSDMNCRPEKGQRIWINDVDYLIETSACEMGQIELGLRRYDE